MRCVHSTDRTLSAKGALWGGCTTVETSARILSQTPNPTTRVSTLPRIPLCPRQQALNVIDADVKSSRWESSENHMLADETLMGCLESLGVQGGMESSLGTCFQSKERQ